VLSHFCDFFLGMQSVLSRERFWHHVLQFGNQQSPRITLPIPNQFKELLEKENCPSLNSFIIHKALWPRTQVSLATEV
jgi:hypothetical protein